MRGYEGDEYENWDEYETDGEEQEEEEGGEDEHEETHQPTQEELEYLALRQKLKENFKKQMKKEMGTTNSGSVDKTNAFRKDNYGSFFGPSQPVIAQRVIQESKTLLENPELAARIAKKTNNKTTVSAPPVRSKSQANHRPSATNGLKKKVEMLKNTRDYSFLLSDDAEVPASSKSPPLRNISAPKSDARSAQLQSRSRPTVNDRAREGRGREPPSNNRDGRKPIPASSHGKPKVGLEKLAHTGKSSVESRKQLGNSNSSGPSRPTGLKGGPSKSSVPATGKMSQPIARNGISGDRRPSSSVQSGARKPTPSNVQSGVRRPSPSNGHQSTHSKRPLAQREYHEPTHLKRPLAQRDYRETSRPKVINKQTLPSARAPLKRSPPRAPHRAPLRDERLKAKPKRQLRDEDCDGEEAISMIRQMFGYNPNKFRDDDDDSDMEANFDDIMREEQRSAKIARKEDEEQLRMIEEEERRERERLAKRRKLGR